MENVPFQHAESKKKMVSNDKEIETNETKKINEKKLTFNIVF
jgi:hypothetical protein